MMVLSELLRSPTGPLEFIGTLELLFLTGSLLQLTMLVSKACSLKPA